MGVGGLERDSSSSKIGGDERGGRFDRQGERGKAADNMHL